MQKALQQMNLQLHHVLSDVTGVTGLKIVRAIVAGERDPLKLAQFRNPACKSSADKIALTGRRYVKFCVNWAGRFTWRRRVDAGIQASV
jgi:hypothetical protein